MHIKFFLKPIRKNYDWEAKWFFNIATRRKRVLQLMISLGFLQGSKMAGDTSTATTAAATTRTKKKKKHDNQKFEKIRGENHIPKKLLTLEIKW